MASAAFSWKVEIEMDDHQEAGEEDIKYGRPTSSNCLDKKVEAGYSTCIHFTVIILCIGNLSLTLPICNYVYILI